MIKALTQPPRNTGVCGGLCGASLRGVYMLHYFIGTLGYGVSSGLFGDFFALSAVCITILIIRKIFFRGD